MRFIQSSPSVGFWPCILTESQGRTPFTPSAFDRKEYRALHSDGRPLQPRGPHTSPQPSNWGLALQPRLLAPNPLPNSSANLSASLSRSCNHRTSMPPPHTPTQCRPPAFLAASHGSLARPVLPQAERSEYHRVPTFHPDGRFVGGISCGL